MALRLTVISGLFPDCEIQVRDNLPVEKLIAAVVRRFDLPETDYALTLHEQALDPTQTLEHLGVRAGTTLKLVPANAQQGSAVIVLRHGHTELYRGSKSSILIGRPNTKGGLSSEMLDVNLTLLDPERRVSRPHARIMMLDNAPYLESLNAANPAFVNGSPVGIGERCALRTQDKLQFGSVILIFEMR